MALRGSWQAASQLLADLDLGQTPSVPFSQATTIWLVALYCCGFAGLLAWNIVALAKGKASFSVDIGLYLNKRLTSCGLPGLQCEGYSSGDYDKGTNRVNLACRAQLKSIFNRSRELCTKHFAVFRNVLYKVRVAFTAELAFADRWTQTRFQCG